MKFLPVRIILLAGLLTLLGCASNPEPVVATGGRVQVTPPSGCWSAVQDGNQHAVLELRCEERDLWLRAWEVPREGLPITPAQGFDRLRMSYGRSKNSRVTNRSPATATTVGDMPALQAEVCYLESEEQAFTSLLTQVEAPDHLYLVDLRTPSKRWQENEAEIKAILASLRPVP